jgi:S-adenosyl-L-methionine hydrolase (adenosine-forming)
MSRPIITLTTDFGVSSPYVAQMKGVILRSCPDANVVDLTHAIPPQDIQAGAIALRDTTPHFPPGSIHIAVVDPGVGGARQILYLEAHGRHFIGPDNGLLSLVATNPPPDRMIAIIDRPLGRNETSYTFHGRDVMAPVAARIAMGVDPASFGQVTREMVPLRIPPPTLSESEILGTVTHIDSFGNAISNIRLADLTHLGRPADHLVFRLGDLMIEGLSLHYAERGAGEYTALVGSNGHLEIARVNGSAAQGLKVRPGERITVRVRCGE